MRVFRTLLFLGLSLGWFVSVAGAFAQQACDSSAFTTAPFTVSFSEAYSFTPNIDNGQVSVTGSYSEQVQGTATVAYRAQSFGTLIFVSTTISGTGSIKSDTLAVDKLGKSSSHVVTAGSGTLDPGSSDIEFDLRTSDCTALVNIAYAIPGTLTSVSTDSAGNTTTDTTNGNLGSTELTTGGCGIHGFAPISVAAGKITYNASCATLSESTSGFPGTLTESFSTSPLSNQRSIKISLGSPTIAPFNKSPVKGQLPPSTNLDNVTIAVSDPTGNPVPNYALDLVVVPVDLMMSAGHNHTNTASAPTGVLFDSSGTFADTCVTGAAGEPCALFYAPDVVSGVFAIAATSVADSNITAKANIKVGVSGLLPLQSQASYRLTGAFPNTSGSMHTANHYSQPYMSVAVPQIAGIYLNLESGSSGPQPTLGINDMSLPLGGIFDIDNLWDNAKGHNLHRSGTSVDIDHADGSGLNLNLVLLDYLMHSSGLCRVIEKGSIHYELGFAGKCL
jgi:hypothetical protein